MPYFSRGSLKGALRMGASVCAETVECTSSDVRPVKEVKVKSVEDLIVWLKIGTVEVVNHEATGDPPSWNP